MTTSHRGYINPPRALGPKDKNISTAGNGAARTRAQAQGGQHPTQMGTLQVPNAAGRDWTLAEIQAAIDRGPHKLALKLDTIKHFAQVVTNKVAKGQARVVLWEDIKANHPRHLKVSPVAAIPHKSRVYRSILGLSFALRLADGNVVKSVNNTTTKLAPQGAINQLGYSLK